MHLTGSSRPGGIPCIRIRRQRNKEGFYLYSTPVTDPFSSDFHQNIHWNMLVHGHQRLSPQIQTQVQIILCNECTNLHPRCISTSEKDLWPARHVGRRWRRIKTQSHNMPQQTSLLPTSIPLASIHPHSSKLCGFYHAVYCGQIL